MSRLWTFIIGLSSLYAARADSFVYSPDGGMVSFGEFDYVYDSASRLTEVWSNMLTSGEQLWHHTRMMHSATRYKRAVRLAAADDALDAPGGPHGH